jgi:hypothetical protein
MAMPAARVPEEPRPAPGDAACAAADALARAAAECARQHERLGNCLEAGCSDDELQHLVSVAALADEHLAKMADAYDRAATAAPDARDEGWWHAANALWHSSREYVRRNSGANDALRSGGKHSKEHLAKVAMEYELERSALMVLKQSEAAYRQCRPQQAA